jgi:hypothetical protein
MGKALAGMRNMNNAYKILAGRPEGESPPGRRRRHRREDNIKVDIREIK